MLNLIVAVDKNWGIGKDNKMMWSIPADMKFFREKTIGHVVVMGRKTMESFPDGRPLKDRVNIVLSRQAGYRVKKALVAHTDEEIKLLLEKFDSAEVYVIGGEDVYRQFLPYCGTAYVTKVDGEFDADAHFPNLDELPEWKRTEEGETRACSDLEYRFTKYERVDSPGQ